MGADPFKERIEQIYRDLERYTYYELLNLPPGAPPDEIRAAFHRMALTVHPDRFHQAEDTELRGKIYTIYKRMTEGYRVLMEPRDRKAYDEGLTHGRFRLVRTERKVTVFKRPEDAVTHPKAKQFFKMALDAEGRGDVKNARINCKFALDMDPDNEVIQSHLEQLEAKELEAQERERKEREK
jgi:curved DNA-binding protein CbpA